MAPKNNDNDDLSGAKLVSARGRIAVSLHLGHQPELMRWLVDHRRSCNGREGL